MLSWRQRDPRTRPRQRPGPWGLLFLTGRDAGRAMVERTAQIGLTAKVASTTDMMIATLDRQSPERHLLDHHTDSTNHPQKCRIRALTLTG